MNHASCKACTLCLPRPLNVYAAPKIYQIDTCYTVSEGKIIQVIFALLIMICHEQPPKKPPNSRATETKAFICNGFFVS